MPDIVDMLQELPHAIKPGPAGPDLAAADVARGHRALRQRRRRRLAGVAGTVAAGAAAVVLVATSAPRSTAPTAGPASHAPAANSPLMSLAARITASSGPLPGNASLEIVKETNGKMMQVLYGLYTDGGDMYSGYDKQTIMTEVAQHANLATGAEPREVAAARYAATGDLATARMRMINATPNDFFLPLAARKKIWEEGAAARQALMREKGIKTPLEMPTGKALQDQIYNSLWINSTEALNWAGGDPEVRAGVLRLLSTIPEVAVASSTTDGQPTLTITAGPAVFGGDGEEVLTVNATTGLPVRSVSATPGMSPGVYTFQVSRVTLADIKAGKF
jgi:hypothetical protein